MKVVKLLVVAFSRALQAEIAVTDNDKIYSECL